MKNVRLKIGEYYYIELQWPFDQVQQFLVKVIGFTPSRCRYHLLACSGLARSEWFAASGEAERAFLYHHHRLHHATVIKRVHVKQIPLYMYLPHKTHHFDEIFIRPQ
jgi:hypothetical protein